jgi:lipopolysaccharide/colanic/teichoic acid biosynthesis glycosyltransferase
MYYLSKRVLDFTIAFLAILFLSPLLAIVAILIKLDSPGPIIFKQDRVGVRRRKYNNVSYWQKVIFPCYKFRTMVCNADQTLHKSYIKALINNDCESMNALQGGESKIRKLTHDPRLTRLG